METKFVCVILIRACFTLFPAQGIFGTSYNEVKEEQDKVLQRLNDYTIVFPHPLGTQQLEGHLIKNWKHQWKNDNGKYPQHISFELKINNATVVIDLEHNKNILSSSYSTSFYPTKSTGKTKDSDKDGRFCHYMGKARHHPSSQVRVSTCSGGLEGYIILPDDDVDDDDMLIIHSIGGNKHIVYHTSDDSLLKNPLHSMVTNSVNSRYQNHSREKRDIETEPLHLELMLVVDSLEWRKHNDMTIMEQRMLAVVNHLDGFLRFLYHPLRVTLTHLEIWNQTVFATENPAHMLDGFMDMVMRNRGIKLKHWRDADAVYLIHGGDFSGDLVVMSPVGTMCGIRSGGIAQATGIGTYTAVGLAHGIGHNLGMLHDTPGCADISPLQTIMTEDHSAGGGLFWTDCSGNYLERNLKLGVGSCLLDSPRREVRRVHHKPVCGNLIVEDGEDCDCGNNCDKKELRGGYPACCNATTCKFIGEAECDYYDERQTCCNFMCKLEPPSTTCRHRADLECDLPEFCDGSSPFCPENFHVENGRRCNGSHVDKSPLSINQAYCQRGVCLSHDAQCRAMWGKGAVSSNLACYEQTNRKGDSIGNCGRKSDGSGEFISCAEEHVLCGKLSCSGGEFGPVSNPEISYHTFNVSTVALAYTTVEITYNLTKINRTLSVNTSRTVTTMHEERDFHECKMVRSHAFVFPFPDGADDFINAGIVMDGSSCGENQACFKGECLVVPPLFGKCSSLECNEKGVCNNRGHCHCDDGWAPPNCVEPGKGGSVDSGLYPSEVNIAGKPLSDLPTAITTATTSATTSVQTSALPSSAAVVGNGSAMPVEATDMASNSTTPVRPVDSENTTITIGFNQRILQLAATVAPNTTLPHHIIPQPREEVTSIAGTRTPTRTKLITTSQTATATTLPLFALPINGERDLEWLGDGNFIFPVDFAERADELDVVDEATRLEEEHDSIPEPEYVEEIIPTVLFNQGQADWKVEQEKKEAEIKEYMREGAVTGPGESIGKVPIFLVIALITIALIVLIIISWYKFYRGKLNRMVTQAKEGAPPNHASNFNEEAHTSFRIDA